MLAAKLTLEWERVTGRSYDSNDPRANYPYVIVCRNGGPSNKRGSGLGSWMRDLDYVLETWEGTKMGETGNFTVMSSENQKAIFDYCFDWGQCEQFNSLEGVMYDWMKYTEEGKEWQDAHSHQLAARDPYHANLLLVAEARRIFLPCGWQTEEEQIPLVYWEDLLANRRDYAMPEEGNE